MYLFNNDQRYNLPIVAPIVALIIIKQVHPAKPLVGMALKGDYTFNNLNVLEMGPLGFSKKENKKDHLYNTIIDCKCQLLGKGDLYRWKGLVKATFTISVWGQFQPLHVCKALDRRCK